MHMEGDSTRFNQAFAFQPQTGIVEGLRQLVGETSAAK